MSEKRKKDTSSEIKIFTPSSKQEYTAARVLFKEYIYSLHTLPDMNTLADIKDPNSELNELEKGKYTPPNGALLLATYKNEAVGVVALRKFSEEICEMKRLYVLPKMRGYKVGRQLAEQIIQKGKELGYQKMRLDTHPSMTKAHQLYYYLGFYDIVKYNENTVSGILFMELNLE